MPEKFVVQILSPARRELTEIVKYISEKESPFLGDTIRATIIKRSKELQFLPEGNPLVPEEPFFSAKVRMVHVKHYVIYFIVDVDEKIVKIIGISHSRRNRKSFLLKNLPAVQPQP